MFIIRPTGNFSRDTFDPLKHYVGVRLQQGVPIVDADWNELEDIRKYELETFLRYFVGDGVPQGSDGFRLESPIDESLNGSITADPKSWQNVENKNPGLIENDFYINPGWCLVKGWQITNEKKILYSEQSNVPKLTTPSSDRTDLIYLDVWEREVNSNEDPNLKNPLIDIETSVRTKREWAVNVLEGSTVLPTIADHQLYPLATLKRAITRPLIISLDLEDLRRTGIAMLSSELTITKDGNVGIGTTNPMARLDVQGGDIRWGNDSRLSVDQGGSIELVGDPNAPGGGIPYIDFHFAGKAPDHTARIINDGEKHLSIEVDSLYLSGNVGIGTVNPGGLLHIKSMSTNNVPLVIEAPDSPVSGDHVGADLAPIRNFIMQSPNGTLCIAATQGNNLIFYWKSAGSLHTGVITAS